MARTRKPAPLARRESAQKAPAAKPNEGRRPGTVEALFQELIRRAATIGLGGFFLTEEALRRALVDVVPPDWVQFVVRQSQDMRGELIDRLAREFGAWMRTVDPQTLARNLLEDYELSIRIEISTKTSRHDGAKEAPDPGTARPRRRAGKGGDSGRMSRNR